MSREYLAIIESKSKVRYSRNKLVVEKVSTNASTSGISPDVVELKDMVKALLFDKKSQNQSPAPVKAVEESCVTCGAYVKANDAVMRNMQTQGQNVQNQLTNLTDLITKFVNSNCASTSSSGTLPSNTIANPRSDLKAITTRSGVSYDGPQIPPPPSFLPKVVEDEPDATKDTVNPTNNGSTEDVQPQVVQYESPILTSEPVTSQISKLVIAPVNALIPMPKFASTLKALIGNKEKLSEMARTPLNKHYSVILLKKLPKKLGNPSKFLIPCDFSSMAECLALAVLGASINLMPLSVWKRLSLPDLTPTCMTLDLADRLISRPVGVVEDVYVKVGLFHFSADFVVVDFDADPRVPLILERSFLKTGRALIDVFEGEVTLRVGKEAIAFNLDQTSRYSANYSDMTAKRIDVIDMDCEEYYREVLEAFLNDDPLLHPPNQGNYLPEVRKELKIYKAKSDKSSIDEPLVVEVKYIPPYLEYAFLEDIKGIDPEFCTHKILMEEEFEPAFQHQRRVNPKIHDVIKQEVIKLLKSRLVYPIYDSPWVSPVHCVPKKGRFTVVENKENELILTRTVTGWHVCIDYHKLNEATRKDHFPLLFMDQMLERLAGNQRYCFLDGFSGYFQILINLKDQEKTTFNCPYGTFAYRREFFLKLSLTFRKDAEEEFTFKVIDIKGAENLTAGHLSRLENPHQNVLNPKEINESFPLETLNLVSTRGVYQARKPLKSSRLATMDPQETSGQVEVSNRGLKRILKREVGENHASWSDKPDDAFSVFPQGLLGPKHANFDLKTEVDHRKVQINELNKLHDQAYENSLIYKKKTKRLHESKIKNRVSNIDDRVLLFNSRLKIFFAKLKSRWSGPFIIFQVYPYGTVELSQPDGPNFKVNGHRLKHYFGEDVPKLVVPDLQTFSRDH
nr:DNA-directed DNA polymerase [Tanacetum cinerariifolium]